MSSSRVCSRARVLEGIERLWDMVAIDGVVFGQNCCKLGRVIHDIKASQAL